MSRSEWLIRPARKKDRHFLERFSCASRDVPWEVEVEDFIQQSLFDWAFEPLARNHDPRLLLVFEKKTNALLGVAAHERTTLQFRGEPPFAATKLELVAVALNWQGKRFRSGSRVSDVVMAAVMRDVIDRVPRRDARVFAVVHEDNARSIALCRRHGLVEDLSSPHPAYRRLVTEQR
jgi:hypothetical protein